MNSLQLKGALAALGAAPGSPDFSGPAALLAAVADARPGVEWLASVRAGSPERLRLSFEADADSRRAAARALGRADFPGKGRGLIEADWDGARKAWIAAGPRAPRPRARFSPEAFPSPIAEGLAAFHAREPLAGVEFGPGSGVWTLLPARPVPWPRFLRCDLSAAFAPRAAALCLAFRDARIVALEFDATALWARLTG